MYLMNRSPEAMVKYLQMSWSDSAKREQMHLERYLKLLGYLMRQSEGRSALRDKVMRLRVEIVAYWEVNIRGKVDINLSEEEAEKVKKMVCVLEMIKQLDAKDKAVAKTVK